MLTVVDQLSRESPLIEVNFSLTGQKVAAALERLLGRVPVPVLLTVDHGT
jgi:putative transposase